MLKAMTMTIAMLTAMTITMTILTAMTRTITLAARSRPLGEIAMTTINSHHNSNSNSNDNNNNDTNYFNAILKPPQNGMNCISIAALKRGEQCKSIDVMRNKRIKSECCGIGVFPLHESFDRDE